MTTSGTHRRARPTIVVAHPDADVCAELVEYLGKAGFDALSVASTAEAGRAAVEQSAAAVVFDEALADLDAGSLMVQLRSAQGAYSILVVGGQTWRPLANGLGIEFVDKPCPPSTLVAALMRSIVREVRARSAG